MKVFSLIPKVWLPSSSWGIFIRPLFSRSRAEFKNPKPGKRPRLQFRSNLRGTPHKIRPFAVTTFLRIMRCQLPIYDRRRWIATSTLGFKKVGFTTTLQLAATTGLSIRSLAHFVTCPRSEFWTLSEILVSSLEMNRCAFRGWNRIFRSVILIRHFRSLDGDAFAFFPNQREHARHRYLTGSTLLD